MAIRAPVGAKNTPYIIKSNDSMRFEQNLARQRTSVDVQVSAVNKWLESGKLPQELIPLYKVL